MKNAFYAVIGCLLSISCAIIISLLFTFLQQRHLQHLHFTTDACEETMRAEIKARRRRDEEDMNFTILPSSDDHLSQHSLSPEEEKSLQRKN